MRKIFQLFAALALVAALALTGVHNVVKAEAGTAGCVLYSETVGDTVLCTTSVDVPGLPAGAALIAEEIPNEEIIGETGPLPPGQIIVGAAISILIEDPTEPGGYLDWVVPAIKICFPVFDGQVKLWVPPSELSSPDWFGVPVAFGVWAPVVTIHESGMTCGLTMEAHGTFAVFQMAP